MFFKVGGCKDFCIYVKYKLFKYKSYKLLLNELFYSLIINLKKWRNYIFNIIFFRFFEIFNIK